ncbi:MAG: NlpC/P60 family protein [Lachnospiraceae bacterium]
MKRRRIAKKILSLCLAVGMIVGMMPIQKAEAVEIQEVEPPKPSIQYNAHVQANGWMSYVKDGKGAGTKGYDLRMDAVHVKLKEADGGITYRLHMQDNGWSDWGKNGKSVGITGKSLRAEAIEIKLTGEIAKKYDVYYRANVQQKGWTDWKKNGKTAGTTGKSLRMEAYQVQLVEKGEKPKTVNDKAQKPKKIPETFGEKVSTYACKFKGNPYRWGGTSLTNGCDCSGFVLGVYRHFGIGLPHSSVAMRSCGREVGVANRQKGDIICYSSNGGNSHVGIYIGNDQVINASNARYGICIRPYNYRAICNVRRMK